MTMQQENSTTESMQTFLTSNHMQDLQKPHSQVNQSGVGAVRNLEPENLQLLSFAAIYSHTVFPVVS